MDKVSYIFGNDTDTADSVKNMETNSIPFDRSVEDHGEVYT